MISLHAVSYFFGALFLTNVIPHLVSGLQGRQFPSSFSTPPGVGPSSPRQNVAWAGINVVLGYPLLWQVGIFDLHDVRHALPAAAGSALAALYVAGRFGKQFGGNSPPAAQLTFAL